MSKELVEALAEVKEDEAVSLVRQAINKGEDPNSILKDCQAAMQIVGERFNCGDYYLPELIASGETLRKIFQIVKPKMQAPGAAPSGGRKGRVLLGTVFGDIHNIGKDTVGFLLDVNGFEVKDLGVDVSEEKFVEAVKEFKPQVVALSGLLTSTYDSMKSTIDAVKKAGLRNQVKIMIGGGQIDEKVKEYVAADAYGKDAMAAVTLVKQWIPER